MVCKIITVVVEAYRPTYLPDFIYPPYVHTFYARITLGYMVSRVISHKNI